MKKPHQGFTLLELLTVIAVVGILFAIAVVAVGKVRESANATKCTANLRSLGQAWLTYGNEHGGASLPYRNPGGGATSWMLQILPYLDTDTSVFTCPSASEPQPSFGIPGSADRGYQWWLNAKNGFVNCGYGMNFYWYADPQNLGTGADPNTLKNKFPQTRFTDLEEPLPVFSDATWPDFRRDSGIPSNFEDPGTYTCAIERHKGIGTNMVFSDGSVRLITMEELFTSVKLFPSESL